MYPFTLNEEVLMAKSMDKGVSKSNKPKLTSKEKWDKIKAKMAAKGSSSSM